MRDDLRLAINEISPDGNGLYAAYISDNDQLCDVENVLLYNIGASAFKILSGNGLCFERGFGSVPLPDSDNLLMNHYYNYSQGSTFRLWNEKATLASWREITLPDTTSISKPHLFWYALKTGNVEYVSHLDLPKRFGIDIQLFIPENAWCNLATIIKPLLDGVIAAFHKQSAPCENVVLQRLSALTGSSVSEVERLFYEVVYPILGTRQIVSAFQQGIKWNPEDDACVACKVKVQRSIDNQSWSMDGRLFSVVTMETPSVMTL